jgi:O-antigen ligase
LGVAKIVSGGTTFIRGYGTFPHPNPFSAFLVAGILILIYFLLNASSKKDKITYSILLFLNILGLTVTFSRGAYLALAFGLIIFFGWIFIKGHIKTSVFAMTTIVISLFLSFLIFKPFLITRATFSDQSTIDRKFYDDVGVRMAQKNPIFGIGMGESVLHMEQFADRKLEPWQKQPPHNYFIIAAAELGFPGALILLWIFMFHLKSLIVNLKSNFSAYFLLLTNLLLCFLVLMQFDHYFYTLQQTQLLLWITLGLIAAETKNPQSGN